MSRETGGSAKLSVGSGNSSSTAWRCARLPEDGRRVAARLRCWRSPRTCCSPGCRSCSSRRVCAPRPPADAGSGSSRPRPPTPHRTPAPRQRRDRPGRGHLPMRMPSTVRGALALASAALVLTACGGGGGGDPLNSGSGQSLRARPRRRTRSSSGPPTSRKRDVGQHLRLRADCQGRGRQHQPEHRQPRGLPQGSAGRSIDLVPEYTGVLLQYFDPTATATAPEDVYTALQAAHPLPLEVLAKSDAEDKDAVVVTKETADAATISRPSPTSRRWRAVHPRRAAGVGDPARRCSRAGRPTA